MATYLHDAPMSAAANGAIDLAILLSLGKRVPMEINDFEIKCQDHGERKLNAVALDRYWCHPQFLV